MNAVSARLFSLAMRCISASSNQDSSGTIAAGLPSNGFSANASICQRRSFMVGYTPQEQLRDLIVRWARAEAPAQHDGTALHARDGLLPLIRLAPDFHPGLATFSLKGRRIFRLVQESAENVHLPLEGRGARGVFARA